MLTNYKEIVYGALFGCVALVLDTLMDARSAGQGFFDEVAHSPGMMLYRFSFVFFGVLFGWLLWKNNQREREVRALLENLRLFHQKYEAEAVVLHTNLQMLLTKNLNLSPEAESLLRSTYEKSRGLQSLARERPVV